MKFITFSVFFLLSFYGFGQKPAIDTSVFDKWPTIGYHYSISGDGKYSYYGLEDNITKVVSYTLVSNYQDWKMKLGELAGVSFSPKGRYAFFLNKHDSLGTIVLGSSAIAYVTGISYYTCFESGNKEWLCLLGADGKLVIRDLSVNKEKIYPDVVNYFFSEDKQRIFIEKKDTAIKELIVYAPALQKEWMFSKYDHYNLSPNGKILLLQTTVDKQQDLQWINIGTGKKTSIWKGTGPEKFVFDREEKQLTFLADAAGAANQRSLYYYRDGIPQAIELQPGSNDAGSSINFKNITELFFTSRGENIIFQVNEKELPRSVTAIATPPDLLLWNYKDESLPTKFFGATAPMNNAVWMTVNIKDKKFVQLGMRGEQIEDKESLKQSAGDFVLIRNDSTVIRSISYVDHKHFLSYYRVSLKNGERKLIAQKNNFYGWKISGAGRFAVVYDRDSLCYFSYDIAADKLYKINLPVPVYDTVSLKAGRSVEFGIAGWMPDDKAVIIFDQYDIWKADPRGIAAPINITNHYGRDNKICFSFFSLTGNVPAENKNLLVGYDTYTKDIGFWKIDQSLKFDTAKGQMFRACLFIPGGVGPQNRVGRVGGVIEVAKDGFFPVKALHSNEYLLQRMTAEDHSNLYVTTDFKSFREVTDIHPEKVYNWISSELIHWQLPDGATQQGILYKPENFDPAKKYPVIFTYYERRSDQLHQFIKPELSGDRINIPYFVSNGYLVFVPDIDFVRKQNGESVVNTVNSAAQYLSGFPWVDATRLGLQGHSMGGWETNYIVTHSHLFAAACTAAGASDFISEYGTVFYSGTKTGGYFHELPNVGSAFGYGYTPWSYPDLYMANSPIFSVENATAPLLIVHGTVDDAVPFAQATEMYLAMQRAGKKVWLLQYNNAGHSLEGENAKDFTIRMKQFFDHYLKGASAPGWMTEKAR